MYGYVRPLKGELKVKEYDLYRAVYCGLCHTLKKQYGLLGRFIVSYDIAFLAMLLSVGAAYPDLCFKRCIVSPFRKKCIVCGLPALEHCAAVTMILFYHKLDDTRRDESILKKIAAGLAILLYHRIYKKAAKRLPQLAKKAAENLAALRGYERAREKSIDRTAHCFADIVREAGAYSELPEDLREPVANILYQTGRFIYFADALDDLEEDKSKNRYNPIALRWNTETQEQKKEAVQELEFIIEHGLSIAAQEYMKLPKGQYAPVLENVIMLGMPAVIRQLLAGGKVNARRKQR